MADEANLEYARRLHCESASHRERRSDCNICLPLLRK